MPPPNPELRRQVINIYKELLNLGKDYPLGFNYFRTRLHGAFMANAGLRDHEQIQTGIARAEYVKRGNGQGHRADVVTRNTEIEAL